MPRCPVRVVPVDDAVHPVVRPAGAVKKGGDVGGLVVHGRRTARYPEIQAALMRRLVVRARVLSMQSAINSIPRIEERVELTLWHLAYRFGHVSRDGIKLDLPLAHTQLAEMVCAQRPSVSTALTRLRSRGRIATSSRGQWLLVGNRPPQLSSQTEDIAGI